MLVRLTGHPPYPHRRFLENPFISTQRLRRRRARWGLFTRRATSLLVGCLRNPEKRPKNAYFVQRLLEAMQEELTGTNVTHSSNQSAVSPLSTDILQQKILANRSATPKAAENSGLELELEEDEQDESASENTSEAAQKSDVPQNRMRKIRRAQKSNVHRT